MSEGPGRRGVLFSEPPPGDDPLAAVERGDETVGAALARVRVARGLDIADVAAHLRIREMFLVALEEENLEQLPGNTYAIGFVRSYANLLGVNGEQAVALFKAERSDEAEQAALVFPEPVAESRIPKGAILFISVLLAATAYGGWYYLSSHDVDLADLVPEVPSTLGGEGAPQTGVSPEQAASTAATSTRAATVTPEPAAKQPPVAEAAPETAPEPSAPKATSGNADTTSSSLTEEPAKSEAKPPSTAEAPADTGSAAPVVMPSKPPPGTEVPQTRAAEALPVPAPPPASEPESGDASTGATQAPPTADTQTANTSADIKLYAKSDSWVQIRGKDGQVVLMRILRTGDTYDVPKEPGLTLMTGNAGAIEIRVNGKPVPPIGPEGAVRRDVVLNAERLEAGTAVER